MRCTNSNTYWWDAEDTGAEGQGVNASLFFLCLSPPVLGIELRTSRILDKHSAMELLGVLFCFGFSRQGFSVALEPVLELALVDQAGLKLTEIRLPLPPEC